MAKGASQVREKSPNSHASVVLWMPALLACNVPTFSGKNGKVKFTDQYAEYVLCVTGFHEHAHSAFAYNEAFFEKYLAWCYNKIG